MGTGNTTLLNSFCFKNSVHPRGHGEHETTPVPALAPPRFIPVGTGNTSYNALLLIYLAVHPRGHGEHFKLTVSSNLGSGSSPWARGTPFASEWYFAFLRFIPVGTGNTSDRADLYQNQSVHPRGHGEHCLMLFYSMKFHGSSPWARGTHLLPSLWKAHHRFIPVGTGNTEQHDRNANFFAVHPRGHGEHFSCVA